MQILVVEDDLVDRKQIERMLKATSLSISGILYVQTLAECIDLVNSKRPDLVLLDLNLPDSSGFQTVQQLSKACPWVTMVVVTGEGHEGLGLKALSEGAQDYLVKGQFDQKVLERVISYARQRQAQQEIIRQERDFIDSLIQTAEVIILVLDTDGRIVTFNPYLQSICGYGLDQVKGKGWFELFVPPDIRDIARGLFEQALAGNTTTTENVWPILTKDGEQRLIEWHAKVLLGPNGQATGLLCTGQDVTDRLAAEQAIRKANLKLKQANEQLRAIHTQLLQSEKLASIGQLAAGMAHEMNTPLGFVASNFQTLRGYMQKLLELLELYEQLTIAVEEGLREKRLELAERIRQRRKELKIDFLLSDISDLFEESKDGLERIAQIVQSLRDFARIDQAEELDEYDINDGLRAILAVAREQIQGCADVRLQLGQTGSVRCRANQINQALYNIILNAAQAIASQARTDRGTITIETFTDDRNVICRISDDGPGIKPEHISRVFDPFFTTRPVGQGKGLGLTTAYDIIVNKHHGRIDVESTEGKGATFTIYLPIQQVAIDSQARPAGGTYAECTGHPT